MVFAVNHSRMPAALSANRVSGSSFSCSDEAITVGGGWLALYNLQGDRVLEESWEQQGERPPSHRSLTR